jgi:hypothetical protein
VPNQQQPQSFEEKNKSELPLGNSPIFEVQLTSGMLTLVKAHVFFFPTALHTEVLQRNLRAGGSSEQLQRALLRRISNCTGGRARDAAYAVAEPCN